eukprot:g181.t1
MYDNVCDEYLKERTINKIDFSKDWQKADSMMCTYIFKLVGKTKIIAQKARRHGASASPSGAHTHAAADCKLCKYPATATPSIVWLRVRTATVPDPDWY